MPFLHPGLWEFSAKNRSVGKIGEEADKDVVVSYSPRTCMYPPALMLGEVSLMVGVQISQVVVGTGRLALLPTVLSGLGLYCRWARLEAR